jgi:hypothetical protein
MSAPLPGFDLESLRIDPADAMGTVSVKQVLLTVPIRKPKRHEFIRVHEAAGYTFDTFLLLLKGEEEDIFLVSPALRSVLLGELKPVRIHLAMNRTGSVFLWPIPLPGPDGKHNPWHKTALEAADLAKTQWVKVSASRETGTYNVFTANGEIRDPEWPEESFDTLFKLGFKDRYIDGPDHPVLRSLQGAC